MPSFSMLGYNGQLHEAHAAWQCLGNGYRIYNPTLMRFHSLDSMSPFGRGGINAYAYAGGEPINHADPTGHVVWPAFALMGAAGLVTAGVALGSGFSGDGKGAALFGAIAGGLLLGAGMVAVGGALHTARAAQMVRDAAAARAAMWARAGQPPRPGRPAVLAATGFGWDGDVIVRRYAVEGGVRMRITAHGSPHMTYWGSQPLDGRELAAQLRKVGTGGAPMDSVQVFSCFGGADGRASMAQVVADELGVPTYGYGRSVWGGWSHGADISSQSRLRFFEPQTGIKRAASAIRNTELNRKARNLDTRRQRQLM